MLPIRSNVGFRTAGVQTNVGFRGLAGGLSAEDRARVDAAIDAAAALDGAIADVEAARSAAVAAAGDAGAAAARITGLTVVSGEATAYDPVTGVLTVQRGERGPVPAHIWQGTALSLQLPDGTMGTPVDLKGGEGDAGPAPAHQWTGTALAFRNPDGTLGSAVDLRGAAGRGWTGGAYDGATGRLTLASDDGLGFQTGDLRGPAGTSASVRTATAATAADLSAQYPNDLIVVPQ